MSTTCPQYRTTWYNPGMKPVIVVPDDPQWPIQFEAIAHRIKMHCVSSLVAIHHVGSTAVPGLWAKPILDIDLEILPEKFELIKAQLEALSCTHEGDLGIEGCEAFKTSLTDWPKHHLYVCPTTSHELKRHLAFRDALRQDDDLRDTYSRIKQAAATHHPMDIEAYIDEKGVWIAMIYTRLGV